MTQLWQELHDQVQPEEAHQHALPQVQGAGGPHTGMQIYCHVIGRLCDTLPLLEYCHLIGQCWLM